MACSLFLKNIQHLLQDQGENVDTLAFVKILQDIQEEFKDKDRRQNAEEEIFSGFGTLFELVGNDETFDLTVITEIFRCLRNGCANCKRNQDIINRREDVFKRTCHVCERLLVKNKEDPSNEDIVCLRCCLQFLCNCVSGCPNNQVLVWNTFFEIFQSLLNVNDEKVFSFTCMVLYNCMKVPDHIDQLLHTAYGLSLTLAIIKRIIHMDSEFGLFILEELFLHGEFFKLVYIDLTYVEKQFLLDAILCSAAKSGHSSSKLLDKTKNPISSPSIVLHEDNLIIIASLFKSEAHTILKLGQQEHVQNMDAVLVHKHLECLCVLTSDPSRYSGVKQDSELLAASVNLLHAMKAIGDHGNSVFRAESKISSQHGCDPDHPVHGLKSDLIRLISNMAYKNKRNQDHVRELAGISLILDHTNIDGRNPFITQWSVFAIRNLLDGNIENQNVVAGLKLEGVADTAQELQRYGLNAEVQDGKLVINTVTQPQPDT